MSENQIIQTIADLNKCADSILYWEHSKPRLAEEFTNRFISTASKLPRAYAPRLTNEAYGVYTRHFR